MQHTKHYVHILKPRNNSAKVSELVFNLFCNSLAHVVAVLIFLFISVDNILRLPFDDRQKVEQELEALRMSVFQFLHPKLQCELGKNHF